MPRSRSQFVCRDCGAETPQWAGQCPGCGAWNTLEETLAAAPAARASRGQYAGDAGVRRLSEVALERETRFSSGLGELDRVLGGGLVEGAAVLLGGEPGIGKSTLLAQCVARLPESHPALYVTGEESLRQVALRARRLGLQGDDIRLQAETSVEAILAAAQSERPGVLVVDSVQTIHSEALGSAPGSVAQVRECAAQLVRFAKASGTVLFLVGHVTKEGQLAGPRVLEHMVDTVLYFESDAGSRYRLLRAVKNRFGAANELGVFAMAEDGLREVRNPSAIFLSRHDTPVAGSAVLVAREGTRPLLVEVQALVADAVLSAPRRVAVGVDASRMGMLLAVLHRHGGVASQGLDVFVNVVGGVRVMETASDLPLLMSVLSSLRDRPIAPHWVLFGEVGLAGEIRPVPSGAERLQEAAKHGFRQALVPAKNRPRDGRGLGGLEVVGVDRLDQAMEALG